MKSTARRSSASTSFSPFSKTSFLVGLCAIWAVSPVIAQHEIILQGNDKLAVLARDGKTVWEIPWRGIHDIHVLPNGDIMLQQGANKIVILDAKSHQVVWSYDSATSNGNAGKPVEVHAFQPLADGSVMIAESGPARIIEVDHDGKLLHQIKLKVDHPHPHTDTRLARKLDDGHYLVCHEGDGVVREYDHDGTVTWEFPVPLFGKKPKAGHGPEAFGNKCFGAVRLANGNTLITTGNGHGVIEVTPAKKIVWKIGQNDLDRISLAWVTTIEVLSNGHYVIGNCHAGPGQPLVVEFDPKTLHVIWQLDRFDDFGNSVSNSHVLDSEGKVIR